jgi:hypothetical protein
MPHLAAPFPGRKCKRQWTVGLPAVQPAAAAVSACLCRGVRAPLPQSRVSTVPAAYGLRVSAGRVHCPHLWTGGVCRLRRPGPEPRGVRGTGHRGSVRWTSGIAGQVPAGRPLSAADTAAAPLSMAGTWRSPAADRPSRPAGCGSDASRGIRCLRRQQHPQRRRPSRPGCPPHGVLPQPADTATVSVVRPALRPPGDGVRTAGVHRGHRRLRAGCCYRKRSPDRWPLVWYRHCR